MCGFFLNFKDADTKGQIIALLKYLDHSLKNVMRSILVFEN